MAFNVDHLVEYKKTIQSGKINDLSLVLYKRIFGLALQESRSIHDLLRRAVA